MSIVDQHFNLSPKVTAVLAMLTTKEPTWAHFLEKAQTFDVSFRTTAYYGRLEGFAITMWTQESPPAESFTLVVGDHHADGLCLEIWGWGDYSDPPLPGDRPEGALLLEVNKDPHEVVEIVVRELKNAYVKARPKPRTLYEHLDD